MGEDAHAEDGPWEPAGPNWQRAKNTDRVNGIVAAELQCDDPEKVAATWGAIAELPVSASNTIELANATLRFVPCTDGRPEGLGGIDVVSPNKAAILEAAEKIGAKRSDTQIYLCGTRINLV